MNRRIAVLSHWLCASLVLMLVGCQTSGETFTPEFSESVAAMPLPVAGEHPRVLFSPGELPEIRQRAGTIGGQRALQDVTWQADHPGKSVLANARAGKPETAQNLVIQAWNQALLHLVTEEPARLENALILLDCWAAQHAEKKSFGDAWRNGYHFALAYDWLYDELAPATRDAMRETMASGMNEQTLHDWEHLGYIRGAHVAGRPCDWGAIAGGSMLMQWMAIAGDDPRASREFFEAIVYQLHYIADLGITAEGYMNAGNGYAGGDFINYGYAVRALEVHGVPLVDHPHLQAMAEWLAYESIPGQYVFDTRSFSNGYHQGLTPLMVTLAKRHGGAAAWLADQARGPERTGSIGVPGLLWGTFSEEPVPPPGLPLHHWSSSMGVSFSRGGWNEGSYFCLTMEPLVPGKTHPDKGSFTFYSHGQNFATDSENGFPQSEDHNIVLIDGKGQYSSGGRSVLDAIPRGALSSGIGDLSHLDVTAAYERHLAYTHTRPGPVDWERLEYGRGLPYRWEFYRPMRHAERIGLYIRGSVQPYTVILDDIQQDDEEREYTWLMHSRVQGELSGAGEVYYPSHYGGSYVQAEQNARVSFTAEATEAGTYTVFVLGRKWPQRKNWFSHHIGLFVNGKSTYIRVHDYLRDWQWYSAGTHELPAGASQVAVAANRGFRVAQAIAVPGADAPPPPRMLEDQPQAELTEGSIVFKRQTELKPEEWSVHQDPHARLRLHFLQPGSDKLEMDFWQKPRAVPTALRAKQKAVRAGFAALLVPYDDTDPAPLITRTGEKSATLQWGDYTDHLVADPAQAATEGSAESLQTDGKFAMVRTRDDDVIGYMLVAGRSLIFRGQTLVESDGEPLHLLHDGESCTVQAASGARGRFARLDARTLTCNHRETKLGEGELAAFAAPVLAEEWQVDLSRDGRLVTVSGAGPLPLKVHAPHAVKCVVNDVSVWFSRDGFGHIYPKVELTELTHGKEPSNSIPADALPLEDGETAVIVAEIPLPRDDWRFRKDPDDVGRKESWYAPDHGEEEWAPIGIGDYWDSFGIKYTGFAWYRRTFTLPEQPPRGTKVELAFDAVDEMAWVWLNGELAGEYFEYGPAGWTEPFFFDVSKLVRWGQPNQITVRVQNTVAGGGIYKPVNLRVVAAPDAPALK